MAHKVLFPAAVVVLTIFIGILLTTHEPEEEPPTESTKPERADYFLANFEIHYHDKKGELRSILRGDHAEHFPVSQVIKVATPRWQAQSKDGANWLAKAPRGSFKRASQTIHLHGDVNIRRRADAARPQLEINTRELLIDAEAGQALTDEQVVATTPQGSAQGIGMTLDYYADRLQLHNQAKGRYEFEQAN